LARRLKQVEHPAGVGVNLVYRRMDDATGALRASGFGGKTPRPSYRAKT
jgi:hypothetical protein